MGIKKKCNFAASTFQILSNGLRKVWGVSVKRVTRKVRVSRMSIKRILIFILLLVWTGISSAQDLYWVLFTDKQDTDFDPYEYFDEKAIHRREQLEIGLYDSTDYPLNESYVAAVSHLSENVVGESRWFNALAVSTYRIDEIRILPFVASVTPILSEGIVAEVSTESFHYSDTEDSSWLLSSQLLRMQGEMFTARGFDGKGVRIAVLDAGYKMADTHPAFQHLHDHHQIIQTYNFPSKKTDVYQQEAHGTMVLSCIAGMNDNTKLGLATGSEFLLAVISDRLAPLKSEVYWVMAAEWADRNGADIINSSFGIAFPHYQPKDMDGTSMAARAANKAASKGILVCQSMGNAGGRPSWYTLVTPADADSVLSVGAITEYSWPSPFTSWGPTADGRLKPNVCAFGTAIVADNSTKNPYAYGSGTSFSSPLVAGFAACAWQYHSDWSNMELKSKIEESGDLFPQHDWRLGFGVPQASYFTKRALLEEIPREILVDSTEVPQVEKRHNNDNYFFDLYTSWGFVAPTCAADHKPLHYGKSESFLAGYRFRGHICKWYLLGGGIEMGATWYNFKEPRFDGTVEDEYRYMHLKKENLRVSFLTAEFFQRFRLWKPFRESTLRYDGLFIDAGIFVGWNFSARHKTIAKQPDSRSSVTTTAPDISRLQWGVRARLGYGILSAYAQYRFNRLEKRTFYADEKVTDFPRLEVGLQIVIHLDWWQFR